MPLNDRKMRRDYILVRERQKLIDVEDETQASSRGRRQRFAVRTVSWDGKTVNETTELEDLWSHRFSVSSQPSSWL